MIVLGIDIDRDEFWSRVDKRSTDECWPWVGQLLTSGYGRFRVCSGDGGRLRSHRVALALAEGEPPDDKPLALHSCDNPPCCNPRHLRWGTQGENVLDAVDRGRMVPPPVNAMRGSANPSSKLDPDRVLAIRVALASGRTQRSIAREFDVAQSTVSEINTGRKWGHV